MLYHIRGTFSVYSGLLKICTIDGVGVFFRQYFKQKSKLPYLKAALTFLTFQLLAADCESLLFSTCPPPFKKRRAALANILLAISIDFSSMSNLA
jgi:hypothetical protein